jgi:hypothetical protein
MVRKIEVTNPVAIGFLLILAAMVFSFVVLTNSWPFISSGIKLGHNTDSAFMLVNARAGDEVTIHYDVDTYNGSLEIKFLKGFIAMAGEDIWKIEISNGKSKDSAKIVVPKTGIYMVHVQEYSYGGLYNIHWVVESTK